MLTFFLFRTLTPPPPTRVSPQVDDNFLKFRSLNLGSWNQKYLVAIEKYFDWFDLGANLAFNCKSPGNDRPQTDLVSISGCFSFIWNVFGFFDLGIGSCCSAVSWLCVCVRVRACVLFIILAQRSYGERTKFLPSIWTCCACPSSVCPSFNATFCRNSQKNEDLYTSRTLNLAVDLLNSQLRHLYEVLRRYSLCPISK